MEKPVPIKRIDLLVHPFYYRQRIRKQFYGKKEAKFLLQLWKGQVDKAAKNNRLFLITPQDLSSQSNLSRDLLGQIVEYAKERLGKRIAFFKDLQISQPFHDGNGRTYYTFEDFCKSNNFKV